MIYISRPPDWWGRGRCRTEPVDPEIFFPGPGRPLADLDAKAFCAECPVRAECLEYALEKGEHYGTWGGMTEKERRAIRRKARNGIPHQQQRRTPEGMASAREIRAMLVRGMSYRKAAAAAGVRVSRVSQASVVLRKIRDVAEHWNRGLSGRDLAEAAGVDIHWINNYLTEAAELGLITRDIA